MSVTQPLIAERYRLLRSLGEGGMGRVWLARDEILHRDVAVKEVVPPPGLTPAEREEMGRRTLREARAAARLTHPNVVRVYDVVTSDRHPWIVMEYVPSRSLHQVIAEDGPLPPRRVAEIGLGVLGALRAAHAAGVTHRDVKPGNVLLTDDGRVVLTDFGLATMVGEANVTRPGLILGSPAYIAPERARDGSAGPESDLWSLGATLFAAVEGHSPYARSTAIETLTALATEEPPPPTRAGPLRSLLDGLLRKEPARRISAAHAETLLRRAAEGSGGWASRLRLVPRPRRTVPPPPVPPARGRASVTPPAVTPGVAAPGVAAPGVARAAAPVVAAAPAPVEAAVPVEEAAPVERVAAIQSAESAADESAAVEPVAAGSTVEAAVARAPDQESPVEGSAAGPAVAAPEAEVSESQVSEVAPSEATLPEATVPEATVPKATLPEVAPVEATLPEAGVPEPEKSEAASPEGETSAEAAVADEPAPPASAPTMTMPAAAHRVGYLWVLGGGVLVLLLVVVLVTGTLGGRPSKPHAGTPRASAAPTGTRAGTPSAAPTAAESATPPPAAPALPDGWQMYHDPTGFTVAAPTGWTVSKEGSILYFRDGTRVFGIDQADQPHWNPVADWTNQESQRANTYYPGYQRIRIVAVNYFLACADWEFTYDQGGVRAHVINRGFVTSDHQAYGIWWSTPDAQWADNQKYFQLITSTFRPKP